ncbi:flagellar brake protein [Planctomycetota bacterium]
MSELKILNGAEPRKILEVVTAEKASVVMSYMSKDKWHSAKVALLKVGVNSFSIALISDNKNCPININIGQQVGISIKHGYGKYILDTKIIDLQPPVDNNSGGTLVLGLPSQLEIVQRRQYFRVQIPENHRVNVLLWPRKAKDTNKPDTKYNHSQGRLIDISAGGLQVAIDFVEKSHFREGQFLGLSFIPVPDEAPLQFGAQIRNIFPTADERDICVGLQIVGLEATEHGRQTLARLCKVVEQLHQLSIANTKDQG